jgi:hypothetical protein
VDAEQEQAEIDEEQAATRVREAELEKRRIEEARAAVQSRDPVRIAETAENLHRVHALHEAKHGHIARSKASLRRAARTAQRLARLRRG